MAEYKIPFKTGAFTWVTVEADNYDDAVDKAFVEGMPGVCAQCAGWGNYAAHSGVELGDEWEADETYYEVDGEYVQVKP